MLIEQAPPGRSETCRPTADTLSTPYQAVRNIFQILIRDDHSLPHEFPAKVEGNTRSLRSAHPEAAYHLLNAEEIRGFLAGNFKSDVVNAYNSLAPYAYKCDLARLCLLFVHGGLYVDLGIRFLTRLEPPLGSGLVAFRDLLVSSKNSWAVLNGLFFATAGRPELRTAIDLIVQNCKNKYYGATALDPTGPSAFGRAIAICNNVLDYWIGDAHVKSNWLQKKTFVFVTPDGKSLALNTKREGGNLKELGLDGTNNYNTFWRSRQVYGERS